MIIQSIMLFILAGLCEIGGGYLVWLWLREGKPAWMGLAGALVLILYGIVPTLQPYPNFGRIYAAYGASLLCFRFFGVGRLTGRCPTPSTSLAQRSVSWASH